MPPSHSSPAAKRNLKPTTPMTAAPLPQTFVAPTDLPTLSPTAPPTDAFTSFVAPAAPPPPPPPPPPTAAAAAMSQPTTPVAGSRKRKWASDHAIEPMATTSPTAPAALAPAASAAGTDMGPPEPPGPRAKKSRTNKLWTAAEEQRLKKMRDEGNSWGEIAKTFPQRTEGSVKKHWYKDMHYAEFGEDESAALLQAIKEYDANKWKVIGAKVNKPAKACEQYAKEHWSGKL